MTALCFWGFEIFICEDFKFLVHSAPIKNKETRHQRIFYACQAIRNGPLTLGWDSPWLDCPPPPPRFGSSPFFDALEKRMFLSLSGFKPRYFGSETCNVQGGSNMTGKNCDLFTHR
jgi:hypothetical protein